jgi:hypothetical protein
MPIQTISGKYNNNGILFASRFGSARKRARLSRSSRTHEGVFDINACLERAKGIEPSYAAWEAAVLPLNYARAVSG